MSLPPQAPAPRSPPSHSTGAATPSPASSTGRHRKARSNPATPVTLSSSGGAMIRVPGASVNGKPSLASAVSANGSSSLSFSSTIPLPPARPAVSRTSSMPSTAPQPVTPPAALASHTTAGTQPASSSQPVSAASVPAAQNSAGSSSTTPSTVATAPTALASAIAATGSSSSTRIFHRSSLDPQSSSADFTDGHTGSGSSSTSGSVSGLNGTSSGGGGGVSSAAVAAAAARERRNSRISFPFPFSPAGTPASSSHPGPLYSSSGGVLPLPPSSSLSPSSVPVSVVKQSPSPPSTPNLRTFLTDGTTAVARRNSGGGSPPSGQSSLSNHPPLPALSLSQPLQSSYPSSAPPSAPSSPQHSHSTSRPVSPFNNDSNHTGPAAPFAVSASPFASPPSSSLSSSHVLLHVRRSYNALSNATESDKNPSLLPSSAAIQSSSLMDGISSPARDRSSREHTPLLAAATVWSSARREGLSQKTVNHSSFSSALSASAAHVDGATGRYSSSWWGWPLSAISPLLSSFSALVFYVQRVRKHYSKPEDRSRPVLSTPSLSNCFPSASAALGPLSFSSSASLGSDHTRGCLRRPIVYGGFALMLVATLYYWLFSSAPPLSSLYSFYFSPSVSPSSLFFRSPPAVSPTDLSVSSSLTLVSIIDLPASPSFLSGSSVSPSPGMVFRWHALMSWSLAVGPSNILLYVENDATCGWLIERPELRGLKCFRVPDIHGTYKRPVLPALFEHAHSHASSEVIAFMARPAFVHPLLPTIVSNVSAILPRFMMVTRRTDVSLPSNTLSPWTFSHFSPSFAAFVVPQQPSYLDNYRHLMTPYIATLEAVFEYASIYGKLHGEYGIDLFVYPRSIFATLDFPPYLAGVYRWDNWLLSEMTLDDSVHVVDASSCTKQPLLILDDSGKEEQPDPSLQHYNDRITKLRSGNQYKLGHANNADYRLDGVCPRCELVKNAQQSIAVLLAKRINRHQYLAVITFEHSMEDALHVQLLHNWLCWAKRVAFTHFVVLVRDSRVAAHLSRQGIPIIVQDTTVSADDSSVAGPAAGGGAGSGSVESTDFATFHVRVLHDVLKNGYNFLTGPATSILLDDPLIHLNRAMDVQAAVNSTSDALTGSQWWAVSATTYGRDFIAKVKECLVRSKQLPRTVKAGMGCVAEVWRSKNKNIKRAALDELRYMMAHSFFKDKRSQRAGMSAVAIDLTDMLDSNNTQRLTNTLHNWHMMLHAPQPDSSKRPQCAQPLYPAISPAPSFDSISAANAFSLKIKVMASFRPRSLASLLHSLQSASYDDDQVELELCVDGLPAVNPTDKEKAKHAEVRKIIDEFAWTQGPLTVSEEKESKKGPGETGDWKGKGAFGAFLSSWQPSSSNPYQVLLLLPEYVIMSPVYYQYVKRLVTHYYLNRQHHDSRMYGISLQSAMPILGTDYDVAEELPADLMLYRYQAVGSLATLFFPQHWVAFQRWLANKHYNTEHGMLMSLSLLDAFANATSSSALAAQNISSPCVPTLASNAWWLAWNDKYNRPVPSNITLEFAIDHLHPLFFTRWLYEAGYYALFPHVPDAQVLVQQSEEDRVRTVYAWSSEKDNALRAEADGGRARLASQLPLHSALPPLHALPLFDVQGWDVNGHLHQPTNEDSKQTAADDRSAAAIAAAASLDDAADSQLGLSAGLSGLSGSTSKLSSKQRSRVLPYRPMHFSHTSQCSIVRRDKRREQQREQQLVLTQSASQQQQPASAASKRSKAAAAAALPAMPAASTPQQPQPHEAPSESEASGQLSRATIASTENEGEEEEAVNRADFRWKG